MTHRYLPLTGAEREKILKTCNVSSFQDLVTQIPGELKLNGLVDIGPALSEPELIKHISSMGMRNEASRMVSFLGQGVYEMSSPKVIDQITNRGEFLTAYTPYQPEVSQGTLQAIFEYQSMLSSLCGMEVSNASLYDGATSVVEGVLMAARLKGRKNGKVLVTEGFYARYKEVLDSYLRPLGFELVTWQAQEQSFLCSAATIADLDPNEVVAVVMQSPNTLGLMESWQELAAAAKRFECRSVAVVTHAHSLALFEPPGSFGVDIVCGEAQSLGIPPGFGGPHLGILCCKKADVRQMPGRLVGATVDSKGQRAFCVTLSTREQHIRREKATSNICSNQNLMAMRACVYMTLMGPSGLLHSARLAHSAAATALADLKKLSLGSKDLTVLEGPHFSEIALLATASKGIVLDEICTRAEAKGMLAGVVVPVGKSKKFTRALVMAFSDLHSPEDVDTLTRIIKDVTGGGA